MNKPVGIILAIGAPIGLFLLFVLAYVTLFATRPTPEETETVSRPAAVFFATAQAEPVQLSVSTQGEVRPTIEIDLTAQVSGRIAYVNPAFVEGGFFEADEVLIQLEDADYRLAVTRAEAQVAQMRQILVREEAEAELAREEWDDLGEGEASPLTLRQPQMAEAQARLAGAQATLAEARLNLSRTRISAPFSGRVRTKAADLGQFVGAGARLGRVFSTDTAEISLPLSDRELALLGMPLAFEAAGPGEGPPVRLSAVVSGERRTWDAHIVRTASAIDPQTRTLQAIVQVEDPYGAAAQAAGAPLVMGLFVEAVIEGRNVATAFSLPRSALRGAGEAYVIRADNTLDIRQVAVADTSSERVVITSGLQAGDRVITSPLRAAATGMAVTPLNSEGEPIEPEGEPSDATQSGSVMAADASATR
ncbi:MAG: efflux RND transporter periplasmic adaptor subunit [Oceanicaulis sp.]